MVVSSIRKTAEKTLAMLCISKGCCPISFGWLLQLSHFIWLSVSTFYMDHFNNFLGGVACLQVLQEGRKVPQHPRLRVQVLAGRLVRPLPAVQKPQPALFHGFFDDFGAKRGSGS